MFCQQTVIDNCEIFYECPKTIKLGKMPADQIQYSEKYFDAIYEYRHVILPMDLAKSVPKSHLLTETEWRNLGVQQSPGWVHYMLHNPEPHVLLFRRPRTDLPATTAPTTPSTIST